MCFTAGQSVVERDVAKMGAYQTPHSCHDWYDAQGIAKMAGARRGLIKRQHTLYDLQPIGHEQYIGAGVDDPSRLRPVTEGVCAH